MAHSEQGLIDCLIDDPNFSFMPFCEKPTVRLRNYCIYDVSKTFCPFFDENTSDSLVYIVPEESEMPSDFHDDTDVFQRKLLLSGDIWSWNGGCDVPADSIFNLRVYQWYFFAVFMIMMIFVLFFHWRFCCYDFLNFLKI